MINQICNCLYCFLFQFSHFIIGLFILIIRYITYITDFILITDHMQLDTNLLSKLIRKTKDRLSEQTAGVNEWVNGLFCILINIQWNRRTAYRHEMNRHHKQSATTHGNNQGSTEWSSKVQSMKAVCLLWVNWICCN